MVLIKLLFLKSKLKGVTYSIFWLHAAIDHCSKEVMQGTLPANCDTFSVECFLMPAIHLKMENSFSPMLGIVSCKQVLFGMVFMYNALYLFHSLHSEILKNLYSSRDLCNTPSITSIGLAPLLFFCS